MSARDSNAGFALLQSVAALALSALAMLLMLTLGSVAVRNSEVSARKTDEVERLATGLSALRRDIGGALMVEVGPERARRVLFFGDSERIGLVVRGQDGEPDRMVAVAARPDPAGGALVRISRPLAPDADGFGGGGWGAPAPILSGPWRFAFSYAAAGAGGMTWRTSWPHPDKLPAVVRVDISDTRPGAEPIPPLVVPVRVDARPPCARSEDERCRERDDALAQAG